MARNTRANAEAKAKEVLSSAVAEFAAAHPEPRSDEHDTILARFRGAAATLKRLTLPEDETDFARAFARVVDKVRVPEPFIIDWMAAAIGIQDGAKSRHAKAEVILKDAVAAIPNMIRAVEIAKLHSDYIDCLTKLEDWLGVELIRRESALQAMSPPKSHEHADALRYFVTMIDSRVAFELRESGKLMRQVRTADLALLATVAFDQEVTEKAVSALRPKP
jgi:hypothetical protein